jgi:glycosyltransferase involved in cell wall biosynthesis
MHPPNLDAARWCKQHIWPLIRADLPDAELHVYGSYGERYAAELDSPKDGFYFKGRAEDALATMQNYKVNLAPLRYGAGLKGKVFDGFLTGTPTVMTPIAAEGIFVDYRWGLGDTQAFAREAVRLHTDIVAWDERQQKERSLCAERFDAATWRQRLPEVMGRAQKRCHAHREANFIGLMLRHHHHRSTEFMSRWIEAKNRQVF